MYLKLSYPLFFLLKYQIVSSNLIATHCMQLSMKQNILIILFLTILGLTLNDNKLSKQFYFKKKSISADGLKILNSIVLGDKASLKKSTKDTFKHFGLMHLLTPSGLHLSSALIVFKYFPRLRYILILTLTSFSFFTAGLWSMKRVLLFSALSPSKLSNQSLLVVTIALSFILGHFHKAPLSFCFSFLFWGAIIFHKKTKLSLITILFLIQLIVSFYFNDQISILTFFINPFLTSAFTLLFPLMCLGKLFYPIGLFFESSLLSPLTLLLAKIEVIQILRLSHSSIILLIFLIILIKRKSVLMICLLLTPLNKVIINNHINLPRKIVPLARHEEILLTRKNKIEFIDRYCIRKEGYYLCKKKASHMGGPSI